MKRLRSLFLKPSLACTARCVHCEERLAFYGALRSPPLDTTELLDVVREASSLGARALHLSGGEPTLYPDLPLLVGEGRRAGMTVILNTNGSRLDESRARGLLEAGLDAVILSIHGATAAGHDSVKRRTGSFDEVLRSVAILRRLRVGLRRRLLITTQTVVSRRNYRELPEILDLICNLEVDGHGFSYVEGDTRGNLLLNEHEIEELRRDVLPALSDRLRRHAFRSPLLKTGALRLVRRLYDARNGDLRAMATGRFHGRGHGRVCRTPSVFAMVLAEGSVLPCNMVEYAGGPVLGNVREGGLRSVLASDPWRRFAEEGFSMCECCPSHHHFHIPISIGLRSLIHLARHNPAEEQKGVGARLGEVLGFRPR